MEEEDGEEKRGCEWNGTSRYPCQLRKISKKRINSVLSVKYILANFPGKGWKYWMIKGKKCVLSNSQKNHPDNLILVRMQKKLSGSLSN